MGRTKTIIGLAAVFVVAFAGTAVANHVYNDVPTNSVFHDEIAEIGAQGCAEGFPGNLFKPEDPLKRQQMARFLSRCGGRVVGVHDTAANMAPVDTEIAQVNFTAKASGFVLVTATGQTSTGQEGNCPCEVLWELDDDTDGMQPPEVTIHGTLDGVATEVGSVFEPMSISHLYAIEQGQTVTYTVYGSYADANLNAIFYEADLSAAFFPFSGDINL